MALTSKMEEVFYVECDGCRRRAPHAFHRISAIYKARRAGFLRHETPEKDRLWLCAVCLRESVTAAVEKAPLKLIEKRS